MEEGRNPPSHLPAGPPCWRRLLPWRGTQRLLPKELLVRSDRGVGVIKSPREPPKIRDAFLRLKAASKRFFWTVLAESEKDNISFLKSTYRNWDNCKVKLYSVSRCAGNVRHFVVRHFWKKRKRGKSVRFVFYSPFVLELSLPFRSDLMDGEGCIEVLPASTSGSYQL